MTTFLAQCKGTMVRQEGFSLIECCIVCAICVVILTLTVSNFSFMRSWLLRADIDTLSAVCNHARYYALATGKQQTITCNLEQNSYTFNQRTYKLSPGVCFGFSKGLKGPPSHPVTPLRSPVTFVASTITCSADGSVSAGTIYLSDDNHEVTYALSNAVSHVSSLRAYIFRQSWHLI